MRITKFLFILVAFSSLVSCGGKPAPKAYNVYKENWEKADPTPMPAWVLSNNVGSKQVCGIGVAGRSYYAESAEAKELSRQRAVQNLAGVFGMTIHQELMTVQHNNEYAASYSDLNRDINIDEALIALVDANAEADYWYDVLGEGPFAYKGFTYARACVDYKTIAEKGHLGNLNLKNSASHASSLNPKVVPSWINDYGRHNDRLCTVGFARPRFNPEETLSSVVEDIRVQLATSVSCWITSYFETLSNNRYDYKQLVTGEINDAVSKGAVVTHFWYDRDGIGPFKEKRTTYGWGCIYPLDIVASSMEKVEEKVAPAQPEQKKTVEAVRERAKAAFDELDAFVETRKDN